MKGIRMLDGSLIRAETWESVEESWRYAGMNSLLADSDSFRQSIAVRASVWSGVELATDGNSYDFLQECERAGLLSTIANASNSEPSAPWDSTPRLVYIEARRKQAEDRLRAKELATAGKGK